MGNEMVKYKDLEKGCKARGSSKEALRKSSVIDERVKNAIEGLRDRHLEVRMACVEALGRLGVKEERVVNALLEGLRDKHLKVRMACAEALGRLGVKEERVINALIERLRDKHLEVGIACSHALQGLGVEGEGEFVQITNVLALVAGGQSSDEALRDATSRILEEIDQKGLQKEIEFFNAEVDGKLKKYSGKYVAIKNCEVIAKGNSYTEVSEKVKKTPYAKARCILIRKVEKGRPIHFVSVPLSVE